jgi:hypothetical protein
MEQRLRNCHLNVIFQVLFLANFDFSVQNMILTCINECYGEFVQNWLNHTCKEIWIATSLQWVWISVGLESPNTGLDIYIAEV